MGLKNLGIFGGSFDPIHNGHIKISLLAQKQLHLDILLFIPVYDQWMKNKGPYATSIDRLDMINVSISNLKNIQTCDIDIKRKKHTYTIVVDTAKGLQLDYSAFTVIDSTALPYKVVAKYRDN